MISKILLSLSPATNIVFLLPDKLIAYRIHSSIVLPMVRSNVVEYGFEEESQLPNLFERLKKDFKPGVEDKWFLGLPLKYFSIVNFSLPKAAEANLEQAVRYALMRHVPHDLSSAYVNYQRISSNNFLEMSAVISRKDALSPFLQAASSAGITPSAVFPSIAFWAMLQQRDGIYLSGGSLETELLVWKKDKILLHVWNKHADDETGRAFLHQSRSLLDNITDVPDSLFLWGSDFSTQEIEQSLDLSFASSKDLSQDSVNDVRKLSSMPYAIDMVPRSVLKQKKIASRIQMAAVVFFCLTLLIYPFTKLAGKKAHLNSIEEEISQVQSQADKLTEIQKENQKLIDYFKSIAQKVNSRSAPPEVLKEATEVVPKTAWVYSFIYTGQKVIMQGEGESATSILEALENSPLFHEVHFDSPVQKRGSQERFKIVARVVR